MNIPYVFNSLAIITRALDVTGDKNSQYDDFYAAFNDVEQAFFKFDEARNAVENHDVEFAHDIEFMHNAYAASINRYNMLIHNAYKYYPAHCVHEIHDMFPKLKMDKYQMPTCKSRWQDKRKNKQMLREQDHAEQIRIFQQFTALQIQTQYLATCSLLPSPVIKT